MYFARMSATAVQFMSVRGCSTHTVPLDHTAKKMLSLLK